jgi:hypothetical protein
MGARYYVSWMARWIAVDPLESKQTPQSPYVYCSNNPIGRVDLDGMKDEKKDEKKTGGDARITPAFVVVSGSSTQLTPTPPKQPSKPFTPSIDKPSIGPVYDSPKPDKVITKDQEYEIHERARAILFANAIREQQSKGYGSMSQERSMTPAERRENDQLNKQYLWENGYFYDGTKRPLKALAENPEFNSFAEKVFDVTSIVDGAEGLYALKGLVGRAEIRSTSIAFHVGNGGEYVSPMKIVREVNRGEKISDLVESLQMRTYTNQVEHAIVRLGPNSEAPGARVIVSGGRDGITFKPGEIDLMFGHTHPYVTGASVADQKALEYLNQSKQYIFEGFDLKPIILRK